MFGEKYLRRIYVEEKMKRWLIAFLLCSLLLLSSCTEEPLPLIAEENKTNSNEQPSVEEPEEEPITETPVEEEAEEQFEMFNPELTYQWAYNGPLYATSEQWGDSAPVEEHFENMDRNGINYALVFFSVELPEEDLLYIEEALKAHPSRIIPFMSPGYGSAEAKTALFNGELVPLYKENFKEAEKTLSEGTIKGFGELEIYAWGIQPENDKLTPLYDFAAANDIAVMFHPQQGKTQVTAIEELVTSYPETTFLIHMFPEEFQTDSDLYIELINDTENLYYTIDADHILYDGQTGLLYKYEKESTENAVAYFIEDFDESYARYLNDAVLRYKPLVDAVPEKVMWGTEIGLEYGYDPEVYDRVIKASREFISEMDPDAQEKLAYQNALRVFGEGAVIKTEEPIALSFFFMSWDFLTKGKKTS